MILQRDKDSGWAIVFAAFLILLFSSIAASILQAAPKNVPLPVVLANTNFQREFAVNVCRLIRYASYAGMIFGIYGIIMWPSGQNTQS